MILRGAIFDMDGTLLDSMPVWERLAVRFLEWMEVKPSADLPEVCRTMSLAEVSVYLHDHYHLPAAPDEIHNQINALLADQYRNHIGLKPHVKSFLQNLQGKGVRMCVATASDRPLVEAALRRLDILGCFSFLITCSEVGAGKNDPLIFQRAMEQLQTPVQETLVFEDAVHAIRTAKKAGFRVAAVYDRSAESDQAEIRSLADYQLASFAEWPAAIILPPDPALPRSDF
ncbi:MAG: HAD family phosphatase [Clostridiaceae bacterium]|nr:HAD family phosphatase [Clostridiaceae bacterium]